MGWIFCQTCKNKFWKKTCCRQNFCNNCFSLHQAEHVKQAKEQERLKQIKQVEQARLKNLELQLQELRNRVELQNEQIRNFELEQERTKQIEQRLGQEQLEETKHVEQDQLRNLKLEPESLKKQTVKTERTKQDKQERLKQVQVNQKRLQTMAKRAQTQVSSNIEFQGTLQYVGPLKSVGDDMYRDIAIKTPTKGLITVTLFGKHTNIEFPRGTITKPVILRLKNIVITKYEGETYYSLGQDGQIRIEQS